jgi:hypothetical protein
LEGVASGAAVLVPVAEGTGEAVLTPEAGFDAELAPGLGAVPGTTAGGFLVALKIAYAMPPPTPTSATSTKIDASALPGRSLRAFGVRLGL